MYVITNGILYDVFVIAVASLINLSLQANHLTGGRYRGSSDVWSPPSPTASGSSPSSRVWPWCLGPFGCGLVELLGEEYLERVAVRRPKRDTRFARTRVAESRAQSLFEPTHGKPTKIALQATLGEQRAHLQAQVVGATAVHCVTTTKGFP